MKDNQEEDISWLFLWGATILYIAILCMSFAGLAVTKPTVGAAFLDFTKDYGSLLAGIPVLIAVLVAKQQLDANRRQHVATIKRSFQKELLLLDHLLDYADWALRYDLQPNFSGDITLIVGPYTGPALDAKELDDVFRNSNLTDAFIKVSGGTFDRKKRSNIFDISNLMKQIVIRQEYYSQYWS